jgi:hypothetical protein
LQLIFSWEIFLKEWDGSMIARGWLQLEGMDAATSREFPDSELPSIARSASSITQ